MSRMKSNPYTIHANSVTHGLACTVQMMREARAVGTARVVESRTGKVLESGAPMVVTLRNPGDNLLMLPGRKCDPRLFLYDLMFHLAGLQVITPLMQHYWPQMRQFTDKVGVFDGAYGAQWSCYAREGQVPQLIKHMRQKPNTRRAYIEHQRLEYSADFLNGSKDIPCNVGIMLERYPNCVGDGHLLQMTVINRSNDVFWGMWGANAYMFTMLLQMIAAVLPNTRVAVDGYRVFSNNAHIYERHFHFLGDKYRRKWLPYRNSYGRLNTDNPPIPLPKDLKDFIRGCDTLRRLLTHEALEDARKFCLDRSLEAEKDVWGNEDTTWDKKLWLVFSRSLLAKDKEGSPTICWSYDEFKNAHAHYNKEKVQ